MHLLHPAGTFAITPASRISIRAVIACRERLSGTGIDWGSGVGGLSVAAARVPAVDRVVGLELSGDNVQAAFSNAERNGVHDKTHFCQSDSFIPESAEEQARVSSLRGQVRFVLANPPSSEGDDGFDFRRRILREAREFLVDGGLVLLSISSQYGSDRIDDLAGKIEGYAHRGVPASTDWVPFDLGRSDLLHCIELYAKTEHQGGYLYSFKSPLNGDTLDARTAIEGYRGTGKSPLSKWQTHLFDYHTQSG